MPILGMFKFFAFRIRDVRSSIVARRIQMQTYLGLQKTLALAFPQPSLLLSPSQVHRVRRFAVLQRIVELDYMRLR